MFSNSKYDTYSTEFLKNSVAQVEFEPTTFGLLVRFSTNTYGFELSEILACSNRFVTYY